jgi:hypothetical protein
MKILFSGNIDVAESRCDVTRVDDGDTRVEIAAEEPEIDPRFAFAAPAGKQLAVEIPLARGGIGNWPLVEAEDILFFGYSAVSGALGFKSAISYFFCMVRHAQRP